MDTYEKLLIEKSLDELLEEARVWSSVESKKGYKEKSLERKKEYKEKIGPGRIRIWPKKIEEGQDYFQEKRENEL